MLINKVLLIKNSVGAVIRTTKQHEVHSSVWHTIRFTIDFTLMGKQSTD